jgi:DNA-binding response OmpR family regulator
VVEDDPTLLHTLERNLAVTGYTVRTATTVEEAVTVLRQEVPQMVVLDIALPDGCGWDVLRELRARYREDVPVVVMSVLRLDRRIADDLGVMAVLGKPFPIDAVLRLVTQGVKCSPGSEDRSRPAWMTAP